MKIKKLHIKNFKSLVDLEIVDPNPFTVFVGANGVGKSNIFEALEFFYYSQILTTEYYTLFGDYYNLFNKGAEVHSELRVEYLFEKYSAFISTAKSESKEKIDGNIGMPALRNTLPFGSNPSANEIYEMRNSSDYKQFTESFSRIFISNTRLLKVIKSDFRRLNLACTNLEKVLKRLLQDEDKKEEILEWLHLFIPGLENIEIRSDNISGTDTLLIYEKGSKIPSSRSLISDGTYNILCLLTAVYQSDEPQFLCIEEPENGLTPDVVKEMVNLFRNACEEKGHYIWINSHSQSLVSQVTPDELIVVDKIKGETKIKQLKGKDFFGLRMDDAWLTNSLGGGLPW